MATARAKLNRSMTQQKKSAPANPDKETAAEDSEEGQILPMPSVAANGQPKRRKATAESMAASQRDISVSEFFAKNRHLLGFDNPRKALLTTIKEAVDNSLDACEEAGILPEIWVRVEQTAPNRFKVSVQDNGPGIVKAQIPNIFGKLLYGSKFHRLRMSRGQQGIGISAAGMYGVLTTGKPVRIISRISAKKPAHYYELQIDTKRNRPEILNGQGEGVDIPPGDAGKKVFEKLGIEWVEVPHGTRVTIELEAKFHRGRGSVDEYLEQSAIANPHITLHYSDPEGNELHYQRSAEELPPEPKEIKPHPYGVELGMLLTMLKETKAPTLSQFFTSSFSRVSSTVARSICEKAQLSVRARPARIGRHEADKLYHAVQETRISAPSTDCITPIGEQLLLKGLRHVVPGEFYVAVTRPPAVYRGNPFVIEAALSYGGASTVERIALEALAELLAESDARAMRKFLMHTFSGLSGDSADKILEAAQLGTRLSPAKLSREEIARLHTAMQTVNLDTGQSMNVLRFANRVPLLFQPGACAMTQSVITNNWRSYGLSQSKGNLPTGRATILVHMASVWVPYTSESKEAIASYPEIQKELRLALQAVGRKLGMYLSRRQKVRQEGERRNTFVRYLREVAGAIHQIKGTNADRLYDQLKKIAQRQTARADMKMDDQGRVLDPESSSDYGDNVIIVNPESNAPA